METSASALNRLSEQVIGCAFQVSTTLGPRFLEKVYENALAHEMRKATLEVAQQPAIQVFYDGVIVGSYVADLLVEKTLLVELKTVRVIDKIHTSQCLNYLKTTSLRLCLLLNFGNPRLEIKRIVSG